MISRLRGRVVELEYPSTLVLDVGGVGYEVTLPSSIFGKLQIDGELDLMIRSITRDDGTTLYGFAGREERLCFDQLRTVQGVGPQVALGVISQLGIAGVVSAVISNDAGAFKRVLGVGARLADRLVLEMKRFVDDASESGVPSSQGEVTGVIGEVKEALLSLGFTSSEVAGVVDDLPGDIGVEESVRIALRRLTR